MTRFMNLGLPLLLALVLLLSVTALPALAQGPDYQIERFTVAGGSGNVTGGSYSAGQTAGQADANPATLTGGSYAVWGGFWQADAAACSPVVTVTVTTDSGAGSLRQGLVDVCADGLVKFAPSLSGQTITLTSAELVIDKSLTISGTVPITISGNNSYQVIWVKSSGIATIRNLAIINGAEDYGAGIYNDGDVTLLNSTLAHNQADSDGGAIYNDGGALTIRNSTLAHNYAGGYGAGIQNDGGTLTVANSTFFSNITDDTAGAINVDDGMLVMTNSTVYSNSGYTTIFGYDSQVTLQNSIVYSNTEGGLELNSDSTLTMTNVIIGGTASSDDCVNNGTMAVNTRNLIEDGTCSAALSGDPKVTTFGNHGGDTDTLMLHPASPAIDAGDAASYPSADQRGKARPLDGDQNNNAVCDIGAVEVYNLSPTAVDDPNESTAKETALTISPLTNDSDPTDDDGGTLVIGAIGNPGHGTAVLSGTTQIVYTPTTAFNGTDVFTYTATDGGLSDTATVTVTVQSSQSGPWNYYFPLILKNYQPLPNLVITALTGNSGGINLTLRNQGDAPVSSDFWVDVYFNPAETPSLNREWETIAPTGAVWGVTDDIPAGGSLTLTTGDRYYRADESSESFPDGAEVYAYVDSVNYDTTYGNVQEHNEADNLYPATDSMGVRAASGGGATSSGLPTR